MAAVNMTFSTDKIAEIANAEAIQHVKSALDNGDAIRSSTESKNLYIININSVNM